MDVQKTKDRRKRKRKTDFKQIQQEDEPAAKRQKVTFEVPTEILLEIFKYLGPTDLIVVGRICQLWNECTGATSCWRLYSTCFATPTGISWEVDRYFKEHDGFLKADVKYIEPKYENLGYRDVHSFELSYKGEYLARYEIVKFKNSFIRFGNANVLEDFILIDPESSHDTSCWAIEARIIPQDTTYQDSQYTIGFSLFFNELVLLSSLKKKRKFPKQELLLKGLDTSHVHNNKMYNLCWNITTHPCDPILVGPDMFGDNVKLYDHQYRAVNWMLYIESLPAISYSTLLPSTISPNIFFDLRDAEKREIVPIDDIKNYQISFKPKGGILADDFGLGKTISAICLVLADKKLNKIELDLPTKNSDKFSSNATLVICPSTLIDQWEEDIARFSELSSMVITEPFQILSKAADLVLLSTEVMQEHFKIGSPLFNVTFRRIILDESHLLFSRGAAWNDFHRDTIQCLSKTYAWCLSATPFPDEYEMKPLQKKCAALTMEFLEFPPLSKDLKKESRWDINSRNDFEAISRYNQQWTMMSTLMWCTKRGHSPELNFSSSTPEIIRIDLTPFEQAVVNMSRDEAKKIAIIAGVGCFHKPLDTLKEEEEKESLRNFFPNFGGAIEAFTTLQFIDKLESIPFLAADPNVEAKIQMINLFGSKLAAIITWVKENIVDKNKKCIMFSRYSKFLQYLSFSLDHYGIDTTVVNSFSEDLPPDNQGNIKKFKQANTGILLIVLDPKIISGLHFKDVDYIVLLDLLSELPSREDSYVKLALGRVTSIGTEPRDIKRVRFIVSNSMDETWYESPEEVNGNTTWLVNNVMENFRN